MRAVAPILLSLMFFSPPLAAHTQTNKVGLRKKPAIAVEAQERPATIQKGKEKSAIVGISLALANIAAPIGLAYAIGGDSDDIELWALGTYAWIAGPFPGLAYAGNQRQGFKGMGVRAVFWVVFLGGVTETVGENWFESFGWALLAAGGTAYSWIGDMATIPSAVKRANNSVSFGPTFFPDGRTGIRLQYRW